MAKSEVLIEMPEFEKQYNLAMVEAEKISSRVRPKHFYTLMKQSVFYAKVVLIYVLGNVFTTCQQMLLKTQLMSKPLVWKKMNQDFFLLMKMHVLDVHYVLIDAQQE